MGASWIASAPPSVQNEFLEALDEAELKALPFLFEFWALEHQLPPVGDWRTWLIMGGRGAGKTRAGAEWVRSLVEGAGPSDPGKARRFGLVGETFDQAREVMVFGESGILALCPPDRRPEWIAGRKMLIWPNGATAQVLSAHDPDALRGLQFDGLWADELGCAAVDKGANEPNRFVDAKSSESGLPYASTGARDELMQQSYLRALLGYYLDPANNPVSAVTGQPMIDVARSHVWAWDARPYPEFPADTEMWSDGENYARGHWISGRAGGRCLSGVVAEICREAGVGNAETSRIHGLVRGYTAGGAETARARLQPLMLAYGFDGFERDGTLVFLSRALAQESIVEDGQAVFTSTDAPTIEHSRAGRAELSGRVRLVHVSADGSYSVRSVEAVEPDEAAGSVSVSELPLVLSGGEAAAMAERWLAEARIARDTVSLGVPPSASRLGVGDILRLGDGAGASYRIDRMTITAHRAIEAVRVEPSVYRAPMRQEEPLRSTAFTLAVPVEGLLMDLPLITGEEAPVGPWFAASADPWPSGAALYSSQTDQSYSLDLVQTGPATIGVTETALPAATAGGVDYGPALRVRLVSGALSSTTPEALLAGANRALIGDGGSENWEVFQFEEAELVAPDTYLLRRRLRGQAGTDGIMPEEWPIGSVFVLLDETPQQIALPASLRDVSRHYRYGPAAKALDHPAYVHREVAVRGAGLRPYRPCHLMVTPSGSDIDLSWIRRTRLDGDSWSAPDVPLGEESERYLVRIIEGGSVLREEATSAPAFRYTAADQALDGWAGGGIAEVAQISASYGVGPFARIALG